MEVRREYLYKALISLLDEALIITIILITLYFIGAPLIFVIATLCFGLIVLILLFYTAYKALIRGCIHDVIGREGIVIEELNPKGLVMINGTLWHAENVDQEKKVIPKGAKVLVVSREGLIVKVRYLGENK